MLLTSRKCRALFLSPAIMLSVPQKPSASCKVGVDLQRLLVAPIKRFSISI